MLAEATTSSVRQMLITPLMATEWLARGGKNRHLRVNWVEALAMAIQRGEWRVTGDTIKLDGNGTVIDGQHRLAAIVKAQTPVESYVIYDVSADVFPVLDVGRSRSNADILSIEGFRNAASLAAAARVLIVWELTGGANVQVSTASGTVTAAQALRYLREHPEIEWWLETAAQMRTQGIPGGDGLWAAMLVLFARLNDTDARVFAERLAGGANLSVGDPILVLRNRLASLPKPLRRHMDTRELAAIIIKAWNAYRRGDKLNMLYWRRGGATPESFPVPQ